jgi:energy-converting hydrogenase A subunit M
MTEMAYERDLTAMKFAILKGAYHAKVVLAMAEDLNIQPHQLRRHLIKTLDMITLESIAPRYDAAKGIINPDPVKEALGYDLYTRFIPIIPCTVMNEACNQVITMVKDGFYEPDAITAAKKFIAGEVFS